jgi:hypothetical protein
VELEARDQQRREAAEKLRAAWRERQANVYIKRPAVSAFGQTGQADIVE